MSRAVFPLMDGVASTGSSNERARLDHVHPHDSTKADKTEMPVPSETTPLMDGTAAKGTETKYARGDHRHPTDTSRQATADRVTAMPSTTERDETTKYYAASAIWKWCNKIVPGYYSTGPNQNDLGWKVGDYCNILGKIWRCTVPNYREAFNDQHWEEVTVLTEELLQKTQNAYRTASIPWAQVDAGSTSTVYTATVPGITEYRDGVCCMLMNGRVTSASGFTVNINGLGAKPVYSTLAAASRATTLFNINYTLLLVYNSKRVEGGCWDAYYGYDSNTNTIGYQLRTNSTSMQTTDKFYRYRLLFTAADNQHYVPVNTSTSTNATTARTVTQRPINPFGAICYYGHTTAINANAYPTSTYMWTQYNFEMGYSFGALTLTQSRPVYIKCAPQSDGSAIIDSTTPYVQTLPNTADGKIYIFLGIATSATTVELVPEHPVYCYRNGAVQIWTPLMAELDALAARIAALEGA